MPCCRLWPRSRGHRTTRILRVQMQLERWRSIMFCNDSIETNRSTLNPAPSNIRRHNFVSSALETVTTRSIFSVVTG